MIAQRTMITRDASPAVQEAVRLLAKQTFTNRWVCEVCGMIHSGVAPQACDSCGSSHALTQLREQHMEMSGRH